MRIAEADNTAQNWPHFGANSRLLLLGQCRHLHQSSAGPTTAAFVECLNLPTFSRNLAQYRPYTKPFVTFTLASISESSRSRVRPMVGTLLGHVSLLPRKNYSESEGTRARHSIGPLLCRKQVLITRDWSRIGRQVHTEVIIPATARYWQPIFGNIFADIGPVLGRI